ncbi:MAG TPA: hypothetical protein VG347_01785, partial [Verrucomicrobiae bacterium]|nr:hypothetical protein [Verrucomicrobiae bacterium]
MSGLSTLLRLIPPGARGATRPTGRELMPTHPDFRWRYDSARLKYLLEVGGEPVKFGGTMNWIHEHWSNLLWGIIVAIGAVWLLIHTFGQSTSRPMLVVKFVVTAAVLWFISNTVVPDFKNGGGDAIHGLILMLLCGGVITVTWRHSIIEMIASPLTNLFDGGNEPPEHKPYYSIANAKRKRGEYHDAIAEVRRQLEKFPNDFEGTMLLASILAENLNDLQGADNILNQYCDWPKAPDAQMAAAWTTLADWHMKHGLDVDAARHSLEKIVARFPESQLALLAQQRLSHLVNTEKILMEQHDRPKMVVKEGVHNLGLRDAGAFLPPPEMEPGQMAAAHIKHLETHPYDADVREKLAVIYARDFKRLDLAS